MTILKATLSDMYPLYWLSSKGGTYHLVSPFYIHTATPILMAQKSSYPKITALAWWTMTGSNCRHPACKAGALPAELIVHVVTRPGIEPGIPP